MTPMTTNINDTMNVTDVPEIDEKVVDQIRCLDCSRKADVGDTDWVSVSYRFGDVSRDDFHCSKCWPRPWVTIIEKEDQGEHLIQLANQLAIEAELATFCGLHDLADTLGAAAQLAGSWSHTAHRVRGTMSASEPRSVVKGT